MTPLTRSLSSGILAGGGLFYCLLATAANADSLPQQIEQLRQQVRILEQRVQQLEHPQHVSGTPTQNTVAPVVTPSPTPTPAAATTVATTSTPVNSVDPALQSLGRLKEAWKGITAGMSNAQVRELLGEPARQFTIDGKPIWYYSYPGVGNGSVMFSAKGQVVGSQNPPFGFW